MLSAIPRLCSSVALAATMCVLVPHVLVAQQPATGRIAGTVIDGSTGRPITGANIEVVGTAARTISDVEGRYRTAPVREGVHTLQVTMISYAPARVDSVRVRADAVATVAVTLQPQALQLEALVATVSSPRAASQAGMLAVQKNAPAVMDGISAEQMSRSPDSDAADAIARVTGISVVDEKFVVVRGLSERYSSTLLNGVELASPEPTRRIVPLDIFPSTLLESIVAVKTATPDLPGDFAAGSVNIQTKDFPAQRVLEAKVSQGYNSLTTFKSLPVFGRHGLRDFSGFDGANRFRRLSDFGNSATAMAESSRGIWRPGSQQVVPDFGLSVQYGDQLGESMRALGYVFSFDYGFKTSYEPDEYFAFVTSASTTPSAVATAQTEHSTTTADWGLLGNATLRLGPSHPIGIKNLVPQASA